MAPNYPYFSCIEMTADKWKLTAQSPPVRRRRIKVELPILVRPHSNLIADIVHDIVREVTGLEGISCAGVDDVGFDCADVVEAGWVDGHVRLDVSNHVPHGV